MYQDNNNFLAFNVVETTDSRYWEFGNPSEYHFLSLSQNSRWISYDEYFKTDTTYMPHQDHWQQIRYIPSTESGIDGKDQLKGDE